MGYTHYFSFGKPPAGTAAQVEAKYKKAILECQKVIYTLSKESGGLSGYCAHTKPGTYGGVLLNGSGDESHEDFVLREHYSQNKPEFCKTARKYYDVAVVACLVVLKHRLGKLIDIGSDGDTVDWNEGLALAKRILGLKTLKVPASIRPGKLRQVV